MFVVNSRRSSFRKRRIKRNLNSFIPNYFLKLYRKQNSVTECSMPHLEIYINIDGPPTKQSTQFNSIEILRVNASGVKYKVPSLDFGLKMRTPTVTRSKVTTDKIL